VAIFEDFAMYSGQGHDRDINHIVPSRLNNCSARRRH
jgi:hypothetical protein